MTASHTSDSARPRMEWRRGRNRSAPVFARSRSVPRQVEHRALVIGTEQIGAQRRTGEDRAVDLDRHIVAGLLRSEEHTSELQSLMRISYAVFCLKKKNNIISQPNIA